jgi:transcriptional regulator with XRE-family HTH domain
MDPHPDLVQAVAAAVTLPELAGVLRLLRRRHGWQHPGGPLTYRELAAKLGSSHGIIGEYFAGNVLPPVDRFDALVALLGASPVERGLLATARDEVEDRRRPLPGRRECAGCRWLPGEVAA